MMSFMSLFWKQDFAANTIEWKKLNNIDPLAHNIIAPGFICFALAYGCIFG